MKNRKGSTLALTALATAFGLAGLALARAGDDDSPLHKAMEQVTAKNAYIVKNYRTAAVFKKNQKEVGENAKALAKLGKDVRDEAGPAKDQKKTQKEWTDLVDAYVKECETFATEVVKDDVTHTQAKDKFKAVTKTCTACHEVFRPEDN